MLEESLDNDAALARAADLAERNDAALTLVHALEVTPGHAAIDRGRAELIAEWRRQLDAIVAPIAEPRRRRRHPGADGAPFRESLTFVESRGVGLVVKAADKPGGPRGLVFGSLDRHLLRKCPAPVVAPTG